MYLILLIIFCRRRLLSMLEKRKRQQTKANNDSLQFEEYPPASPAAPSTNDLRLVFPPPALCTDNGVMAAWAGIEKLCMGVSDDPSEQEVVARWPLGERVEGGQAVFPK